MTNKSRKLPKQADDAKELIELIKKLDYGDRSEIKGIMIGLTMKATTPPDKVA